MTSSAAAFLPAVPQPPHDPRNLRLGHRTGWRDALLDHVVLRQPETGCVPVPGLLRLAGDPATDWSLGGGPLGAFGGLAAPRNVAAAPDGGLLLLDAGRAVLRRFDGCDCVFRDIPHTGGPGHGPRHFDVPGGIATCGELLLIADSGNARIGVFSLYGYLLRGHWAPPAAMIPAGWQPVDVAARRGRVAVADRANGSVHFFNAAGRWLAARSGLGAVNAVTFDRDGLIYVASDGADAVRILQWPDGAELGIESRPDLVADRFAAPPVTLRPDGLLDLSHRCTGQAGAIFDLSGQRVTGAGPAGPLFATSGRFITGAVDSRIYRCQWDRIALTLDLPDATAVRIAAFTAETVLTDAEIAALPDTAWAPAPRAQPGAVADGTWDALIRAEPGRYLWLRLDLSGDGTASPAIEAIDLYFPRVSLRRYLPAVFGEEPVAADFTDRFLAIFDRGLRSIEVQTDQAARFYDPLSAPAEPGRRDFLGWLASWIGVTLDRQLPLARRRKILKGAGKLFKLRGTKSGLRQMLGLYLGIDEYGCDRPDRPCCAPCTSPPPPAWQPPRLILEHFSLRRWLFVSTGRLNNDARLWGERIVNRSQLTADASGPPGGAQLGVTQLKTTQDPHRDPFHHYAHKFSVFLPAWIGRIKGRRRSAERLIRAESPVHTAPAIQWVEPRFRVGVQSMIGFDAVIGCYPQGVILDNSLLGRATVLGAADGRDRPMRIGRRARIGATTMT